MRKVWRNTGSGTQKLRNPRMVILNTAVDITLENITENLTQQNSELALRKESKEPKYCYTTKKGTRNTVKEVNSDARKKLLHKRVKLGWTISKVDDYLVAKRCFRCSKYNHTHKVCKGNRYVLCAQGTIN
jgi:ribosomal protein S3AE